MPVYDIQRWDAIIPKDTEFPYPAVYIKADDNFIEYAKANKNIVLCTVSESGSDFDGVELTGFIASSRDYPSFRPNFFQDTNYYVITLFRNWGSYPPNNGKISLRGTAGENAINSAEIPETKFVAPKPFPFPPSFETYSTVGGQSPPANKSLSNKEIFWLIVIFFVVFGLLLFLSFRK